jgi:tRNA pseudouridine55 synthase
MQFNFVEGEKFLVNKPLEWTSFDVVNKIRHEIQKIKDTHGNRIYKTLKVGHAGTLDPLATGLLIICTGKLTKKLDDLQAERKEYTGEIFLGATTSSYDKETEVDNTFDTSHINNEMIFATAKQLTGELEQTPPAHSAIKQDGVRLYVKARRGEQMVIKTKNITVFEFEITGINLPLISFRVVCSKGTYLRSLANDFGKLLNSGAYLHSLCRTKSGDHDLKEAWQMTDLVTELRKII